MHPTGMASLARNLANIGPVIPASRLGAQAIFTDAAARGAAVPAGAGQLGVQVDTSALYIATGTAAGNWTGLSAASIPTGTAGHVVTIGGGGALVDSGYLIGSGANNLLRLDGVAKIAQTNIPETLLAHNGTTHTVTLQLCNTANVTPGSLFDFGLSRQMFIGVASIKGTNDAIAQAVSTTAGYGIFEAYASAGLVLQTGGNARPVVISVNRGEVFRFTTNGFADRGAAAGCFTADGKLWISSSSAPGTVPASGGVLYVSGTNLSFVDSSGASHQLIGSGGGGYPSAITCDTLNAAIEIDCDADINSTGGVFNGDGSGLTNLQPSAIAGGATGSFISQDGFTVTVDSGVITSIS